MSPGACVAPCTIYTIRTQACAAPRCVVLPVYYAAEAGADLESLAARAGLSVQEVIDLHTGTEYRVYAIGFAPGFAYLGEVDERIAAPRLATPRARVRTRFSRPSQSARPPCTRRSLRAAGT